MIRDHVLSAQRKNEEKLTHFQKKKPHSGKCNLHNYYTHTEKKTLRFLFFSLQLLLCFLESSKKYTHEIPFH